MKRIIALNGSLRRESSNGHLLNAIKDNLKNIEFTQYSSLGNLPHFNPDLSFAEVVLDFKAQINSADYLLIVTPEYAHGIPGVLKNALDWLVSDENLPGKDVILFVCSAGDGVNAMNSLIEITKTMSLNVLSERCFNISAIRSKFANGKLVDQKLKDLLYMLEESLLS